MNGDLSAFLQGLARQLRGGLTPAGVGCADDQDASEGSQLSAMRRQQGLVNEAYNTLMSVITTTAPRRPPTATSVHSIVTKFNSSSQHLNRLTQDDTTGSACVDGEVLAHIKRLELLAQSVARYPMYINSAAVLMGLSGCTVSIASCAKQTFFAPAPVYSDSAAAATYAALVRRYPDGFSTRRFVTAVQSVSPPHPDRAPSPQRLPRRDRRDE